MWVITGNVRSIRRRTLKWAAGAVSLWLGVMSSQVSVDASTGVASLRVVKPFAFISRTGSKLYASGRVFRFSGANIYWLGLDENVGGVGYPTHFRIDDALETAKDMGATVIRSQTLGISVGNPLSVEPVLGQFNNQAFDTIDYAIARAGKLGIHLMIPLSDNWAYYHGGKHTFTDWRGLSDQSEFYTNPKVIHDFEQYIDHILTHVNPYTGLALRNDPTVMAWELGNELNGMPTAWVSSISMYIKHLAPHQLVAEGQQSGVDVNNLRVSSVDIYDAHYYPATWPVVQNDAALVASAGKVYMVGEYPLQAADPSFYAGIQQDKQVSGDLFWSLFAHNDTYGYVQHNDGYTIHYPGDDSAMRQWTTWYRTHAFRMSGRPIPPVAKPGIPLITGAPRIGHDIQLEWRGSTDASGYNVEMSTAGPAGPWTSMGRVTDNELPWANAHAPTATFWLRVIAYNTSGAESSPSVPYEIHW